MNSSVKKGDWVQIKQTILEPGQRAPQVPKDTSQLPLIRLVKGFLAEDASLGDNVTITTVIGRVMSGKLVAVNPRYDHSFGPPPPGFTGIGSNLRKVLSNDN